MYKANGKLVFSDRTQFENCAQCLEEEIESYNEAYENQYPTATAEELDALDEQNNFNEWYPLVQFESGKSFVSLRSIIEAQSNTWLDSKTGENINFDEDPDDICPIMDEATRSLFNSNGLVTIGGQDVSMQEYTDVAEAPGFCCAFLRSTKITYDYNNTPFLFNRKVDAKIKVKSGIAISTLTGKIKHYRKINNSYKKKRANMRLNIAGIPMIQGCAESPKNWTAFKGYKNRKTRTVKARVLSLWREAFVCSGDPMWPKDRCGLSFFVDDENHGFLLYLKKN